MRSKEEVNREELIKTSTCTSKRMLHNCVPVFGLTWIHMSDRSKGWTLFCFLKKSQTFNLRLHVSLMFSVCSPLLVLFRTHVRIFTRSPVTKWFYEMNIRVMSGESKTTLNPFPFPFPLATGIDRGFVHFFS